MCPCMIPFEVIPFPPYSVARDLESPARLSLAVLDKTRFGMGCRNVVEVMKTSLPHFFRSMPGTTRLASHTALIKSNLTPSSQSASSSSLKVPGLGGPVLYARTSTGPNFAEAFLTSWSTSSLIVRSALNEYTSELQSRGHLV